ncbi:MAG: hypothetical protein JJT90_18995 [Ectothiorhodospiraceae bacterium]|nr:hypothetical protein [Ectothiorhodospiraceae bacterium]
MIEVVTSVSLWELFKHAGRWVTNLKRAGTERKRESVTALRQVILAAQRTSVYLRQLKDTRERDHHQEMDLSVLWAELGFQLEDLGLEELAQRCRIKGKHWADPDNMDADVLRKADVGLARMEELANEVLADVRG